MNEYRIEDITVGKEESFTVLVTEAMMDSFREMTGDVNPLHADKGYAADKGYDDKVCFGMLTASFLSTLAGVYLPGKYSLIQTVEIKFNKPVYPGDELTVTGRVTEKDERFGFIRVKAEVTLRSGEKKLKAVMQIGVG